MLSHRAPNNLEYFIKILGYKQHVAFMKNYITHAGMRRTLSNYSFFPNEKEDLFLFIIGRTCTIAKDTYGK